MSFTRRFGSIGLMLCLAVFMIVPGKGQAQEQVEYAPRIKALFEQALQVRSVEQDEWADMGLRSDAVCELTRLAVRTGDEELIDAHLAELHRIAKQWADGGDEYGRDAVRAYICLALWAKGEKERALRMAGAIPTLSQRAFTLNMLACAMLASEDEEGYGKWVVESDRVFAAAMRADQIKTEEAREWPSFLYWLMLEERINVVVETGPVDFAAEELARWAFRLKEMPLQQGAKGECMATIAYGHARLDDEKQAGVILVQASFAIQADRKAEDQGEYFYGADNGEVETVRALSALGRWDEAEQALGRIESLGFKSFGWNVIAEQASLKGEPQRAQKALTRGSEFIQQAEGAIQSPEHGPFGEGREWEDPWYGYASVSLFWDSYYCGRSHARAGMVERLVAQQAGYKTEVAKLGSEIGVLLGQMISTQPTADSAGPAEDVGG